MSAQSFEFDRVFGPESSQEAVFEDVAQLTTSALDGYNVCIFAYGQTGAHFIRVLIFFKVCLGFFLTFPHLHKGNAGHLPAWEDWEGFHACQRPALQGNQCGLACGAGAGKTYTMEGTKADPGICYRTMRELFRCGPPTLHAILREALVRLCFPAVAAIRSNADPRCFMSGGGCYLTHAAAHITGLSCTPAPMQQHTHRALMRTPALAQVH